VSQCCLRRGVRCETCAGSLQPTFGARFGPVILQATHLRTGRMEVPYGVDVQYLSHHRG
jgi:hypothetical protein